MAQWSGQFTDLTHASKLADAEETLRVAVLAFRATPSEAAKGKVVRRLAATEDAEWMSGKSRNRLAPVLTGGSSWMSDRSAEGGHYQIVVADYPGNPWTYLRDMLNQLTIRPTGKN